MVSLLDLVLVNPFLTGFFVFFLLFCDLYLARVGFRLSLQEYRNYIEFELYETTQRYRHMQQNSSIHIKEIVVRGIAGFLVFVSMFFYFIPEPPYLLPPWMELILGCILLGYFTLVLDRLEKIAIYKFVRKNPESLSGHIRLTASYSYHSSAISTAIDGCLWLILFIFLNRTFFLGGSLYAFLLALRWHRQGITQKTSKIFPSEDKQQISEDTEYCIHCGAQKPSEAKFCGNCGASYSSTELSEN